MFLLLQREIRRREKMQEKPGSITTVAGLTTQAERVRGLNRSGYNPKP